MPNTLPLPSQRFRRSVSVAVVLALATLLSACSSGGFDPSDLMDFIDTKKKLPGDRKAVFPEGVPGVEQGVPPELMKGAQAAQQQQEEQAAAEAAAKAEEDKAKAEAKAKAKAARAKPKPKPKAAQAAPAATQPAAAPPAQQQPAPPPFPAPLPSGSFSRQ